MEGSGLMPTLHFSDNDCNADITASLSLSSRVAELEDIRSDSDS